MRVALGWRWFGKRASVASALPRAQALGLEAVCLEGGAPGAHGGRTLFQAAGIDVLGVAVPEGLGPAAPDAGAWTVALERACRAASALDAPVVVAEGGPLAGEEADHLAREDEAQAARARRGEAVEAAPLEAGRHATREDAADRAARALHGPLRTGVPLALRNAGHADQLLAFEETGWLLADLPGLGLHFDPARAWRLERLGLGPPPPAWVEAYGARMRAIVLHGLGPSWEGGAHPEDEGPDWATLAPELPRRPVRILDLEPTLAEATVRDALRFARR